jgi:hypothetical protein
LLPSHTLGVSHVVVVVVVVAAAVDCKIAEYTVLRCPPVA